MKIHLTVLVVKHMKGNHFDNKEHYRLADSIHQQPSPDSQNQNTYKSQ